MKIPFAHKHSNFRSRPWSNSSRPKPAICVARSAISGEKTVTSSTVFATFKHMDEESLIKLMRGLSPRDSLISVHGGEPFVYKHIDTLLESAARATIRRHVLHERHTPQISLEPARKNTKPDLSAIDRRRRADARQSTRQRNFQSGARVDARAFELRRAAWTCLCRP